MLYTRETHTPFLVPVFSLSSSISVVPPTPPPLSESQCSGIPARVTRPSVPAGWGRGGMRPDARLRGRASWQSDPTSAAGSPGQEGRGAPIGGQRCWAPPGVWVSITRWGALGPPPPATPRTVRGLIFRLHPTSVSLRSCYFVAPVPSGALECGGLDGLRCVSGAFGSWKGKCRLIHRRVTHRWGSTCGNVHVRIIEYV